MEEYRITEDYGTYRQPVASVVETPEGKALYRNINESKHIFRKGDYQSIGTDDVVIRWVSENVPDIRTVIFDTGNKTYITSIEVYKGTKPKHMMGRLQRFVSLDRFSVGQPLHKGRPEKEIVIPARQ